MIPVLRGGKPANPSGLLLVTLALTGHSIGTINEMLALGTKGYYLAIMPRR